MRRDYFLFSFLMVVLATSCEVPIDIEGDKQLVVQSYFSDSQDLIVYVSESNLRSEEGNSVVNNAVVTLFSGHDFQFIASLVFVSDAKQSYYKSVDFHPVVGEVYMLSVEVPGYKPVTASTSIPQAVIIDDVDLDNTVIKEETGISQIQFSVTVSIKDPIEHINYYHLIFAQELISSRIGGDGQLINDTIFLTSDKELFVECTTKSINVQQFNKYPSFILDDNGFNGEHIKINFKGHYAFDDYKYDMGEFTIEMRTVSDAYYRHFLNLLNRPNNGNGYPSLGFDDAYSNIINGTGIFAGYTTNINRYNLPN